MLIEDEILKHKGSVDYMKQRIKDIEDSILKNHSTIIELNSLIKEKEEFIGFLEKIKRDE